MDQEKEKIYVFGYGISLIIPFFIIFHSLEIEQKMLAFLLFVGGFVLIMAASVKMAKLKPLMNSWVYPVLLYALIQNLVSGYSLLGLFFLGVAIVVLTLTIKDVENIRSMYTRWMKLAHLIGTFMSALVLSLLFIVIFTPAGIILRLLRKDLLDQKWGTGKDSYWHFRPKEELSKERYRQQF